MRTIAVNPAANAILLGCGQWSQIQEERQVCVHDSARPDKSGRQLWPGGTGARTKICVEHARRSSAELPGFEQLLPCALGGDAGSMRALIGILHPIIRARAVRVLRRYRPGAGGKNAGPDADDLVQEVWARLFADGARELRGWVPERGLGLPGYVGLIAERDMISILRRRSHNPCIKDVAGPEPEIAEQTAAAPSPESECASREMLWRVIGALRAELGTKGGAIFELLMVEEQPLEQVCRVMEMSRDAVYTWRSRVARRARVLIAELSSEIPAPVPRNRAVPGNPQRSGRGDRACPIQTKKPNARSACKKPLPDNHHVPPQVAA